MFRINFERSVRIEGCPDSGVAAIDCGDGAAAGIDAAGVGSDRTGRTFCLGYTNTQ